MTYESKIIEDLKKFLETDISKEKYKCNISSACILTSIIEYSYEELMYAMQSVLRKDKNNKKLKIPDVLKISFNLKKSLLYYVENYLKVYLLLISNSDNSELDTKINYSKMLGEEFGILILNSEIKVYFNIKEMFESIEAPKLKNSMVFDIENIIEYIENYEMYDDNLNNIIMNKIDDINLKKEEMEKIICMSRDNPSIKIRNMFIDDLIAELRKNQTLKNRKKTITIINKYEKKVNLLNSLYIPYLLKEAWKNIQELIGTINTQEIVNEITNGSILNDIFLDDIIAQSNCINKEGKIDKEYVDRFNFEDCNESNKFKQLRAWLIKKGTVDNELIATIAKDFAKYYLEDCNELNKFKQLHAWLIKKGTIDNKLIVTIAKDFAKYYLKEEQIEEQIEDEISYYVEENIIKTLLYVNSPKEVIIKEFKDDDNEYNKYWKFIAGLDFYDQASENIGGKLLKQQVNTNKFNKYTENDIKYLYHVRINGDFTKRNLMKKDKFKNFIQNFICVINNNIEQDYIFKYKIEDLERFYAFDLILDICKIVKTDRDIEVESIISELYNIPLLEYRKKLLLKYDKIKHKNIAEKINRVINNTMFNTIEMIKMYDRTIIGLKNNKLIDLYTIKKEEKREDIIERVFKNVKDINNFKVTEFKNVSQIFFDKIDRFGFKSYK